MILNNSAGAWSTGITLRWHEHAGSRNAVSSSGWSGELDYLDDGFCSDEADTHTISTEGVLRTRYLVVGGEKVDGLTAVINTLLIDATKLGVQFRIGAGAPMLYYDGDGENASCPPPHGWREMLRAQAERIGWATYGYQPEEGSLQVITVARAQ